MNDGQVGGHTDRDGRGSAYTEIRCALGQGTETSGIGDFLVRLRSEGSVAGPLRTRFQAPPTFEVHSSISIEVHISDNFLYVPVSHLMTQELPHGLSQLARTYLPVTVGVKLGSVKRGKEGFVDEREDPKTERAHPCLLSPVTHLPKGVSQLLYTNHISRLRQELRAHQFHKVIKIHVATHWRKKKGPLTKQPPPPSPPSPGPGCDRGQ